MRKKNILGNFVKNEGVLYEYEIKKLADEPEAYSALITFLPGTRELHVNERSLCLVSDSYKWLMYLPLNEFWCITVFFSPENEILDWYFDITLGNFLDEEGMPCMNDLYLDLVIQPNGQTITLDADELQEALETGEISIDDYRHAYRIHDQIKCSKWSDVVFLSQLSAKLLAEFV